ncbi:MAG TPA: hypothetical protein VN175_08775 [Rhizomicrobium sp.]|jgi:hypothetical protein|nr:hypothetical protein [Rhizomicrobium sp.]
MQATYFAVSVIVAVLVIFWGSAEVEPAKLAKLFGPRPPEDKPAPKPKVRW